MRVALVHDWLTGMRGGEQCLQAFLELYPDAHIYTLLHVPGSTTAQIDAAVRGTSSLNRLPAVKKYYRCLLPFFPMAIRSLKIPNRYDLVISLSHAAAKNVQVPTGATHICYCFTPMRYIWDQVESYLGMLRFPAWPLIKYLRSWDLKGANTVDQFVAISRFVAARIRCFFGRDAYVVYPPVSPLPASAQVEAKSAQPGEYFLCAGALVPYKRIDLAVRVFNQSGEKLIIAGTGPELKKLKQIAKKNIVFMGRVSNEQLADLYAGARALIFPGTEDFGMMPVECMAAGRPVIGFAAGGLLETVRAVRIAGENRPPLLGHQIREFAYTGVLVDMQADRQRALSEAIAYFKLYEPCFSAEACRKQAAKFSIEAFRSGWEQVVSDCGLNAKAPVRPWSSAA